MLPNILFLNEQTYYKKPVVKNEIRQVRLWSDPIMNKYGFDVNQVNTSNFQAVMTWNDGNREFGGVTNFLRIPKGEMYLVRDMQFNEETPRGIFNKDDKMEWLCQYRGRIFMYENREDHWTTANYTRWGTICIGGNYVQVDRYENILWSFNNEPVREYEMARLVGFRREDWGRSRAELLAEGLIHRDFCAYPPDNKLGDSPKGMVFSPFFSPLDYDFAGTAQPTALYIPTMWLEDKN